MLPTFTVVRVSATGAAGDFNSYGRCIRIRWWCNIMIVELMMNYPSNGDNRSNNFSFQFHIMQQ